MARMAPYMGNGLGQIIAGYHEGQDRQRKISDDLAKARLEGQQFNTQHDIYGRNTYDKRGMPNGIEDDPSQIERDTPINKQLSREYFERNINNPAVKQPLPEAAPSPAPSAMNRTPQGQPETGPAAPYRAPQAPAAPSEPNPLVRDPKLALADRQAGHDVVAAKQAQSVVGGTGEKVVMPEGATSMEYDLNDKPVTKDGKTFIPARKTTVPATEMGESGGYGMNIAAEAPPPEAPAPAAPIPAPIAGPAPASEDFHPTRQMLQMITKRNTTKPSSANAMVDVASLTPLQQSLIGASEEMIANHQMLPRSLVEKLTAGEQRIDAAGLHGSGSNKVPSSEALPFIKKVEGGQMSPADALAHMSGLGIQPTSADYSALKDASSRGNQDRGYTLRVNGLDLRAKNMDQRSAQNAQNAIDKDKILGIYQQRIDGATKIQNLMDGADDGKFASTNAMLQQLNSEIYRLEIGAQSGTLTGQEKTDMIDYSASLSAIVDRFQGTQTDADLREAFKQARGMIADLKNSYLEASKRRGEMLASGAQENQKDTFAAKLGKMSEQAKPTPRHAPNFNSDKGRANAMAQKNAAMQYVMQDESRSAQQKRIDVQKIQDEFDRLSKEGRASQGISQ